ncbi:hypothetical protein AHAS_Ahas17G0196200 [Arachis hypogaea]
METGVLFYKMDPPYIYEDPVQHRFYVVAAKIRALPVALLYPDAPFYQFHDEPIPHQHPDQPKDQVDPEPEPMDEHISEPIPKEDIPVEQVLVSSFKPSSEEPLTTSISGPASVGQISSTSARVPPEIVEISDDKDEDPNFL